MPYRIDLIDPPSAAFDRLVALGAFDVDVIGGTLAAILPDDVSPSRVLEQLGPVPFSTRPAVGRDDGSVWLVHPRAARVGSLRIVPAGAPAEDRDIRLVDGPAFGTGLHPTTALGLEAMEGEILAARPRAMLDVGAGSGVLALAALVLGVARAVAVDLDSAATATSRANAVLNGLSTRLSIVQGPPGTLRGAWPLVVANIQAAPLIEMAPTLAQLVGRHGCLILSGVRSSLRDEVAHAYRRIGMHGVGEQAREGWMALTFRASW